MPPPDCLLIVHPLACLGDAEVELTRGVVWIAALAVGDQARTSARRTRWQGLTLVQLDGSALCAPSPTPPRPQPAAAARRRAHGDATGGRLEAGSFAPPLRCGVPDSIAGVGRTTSTKYVLKVGTKVSSAPLGFLLRNAVPHRASAACIVLVTRRILSIRSPRWRECAPAPSARDKNDGHLNGLSMATLAAFTAINGYPGCHLTWRHASQQPDIARHVIQLTDTARHVIQRMAGARLAATLQRFENNSVHFLTQ